LTQESITLNGQQIGYANCWIDWIGADSAH